MGFFILPFMIAISDNNVICQKLIHCVSPLSLMLC